jgi:dihydrodipicolinate synthase/N-acetylneuraminate lyase
LAPLLGDGAVVFTGNDDLMVEAHAVGGAGIVSGVSSALPEPFVDLAEALRLNVDVDSSRAIVNDTVSVLGTSIRQIKTALLQLSVFDSDRCRMAIPQQQSADAPEVARLLERSRSANSAQRIG